MYLKGTGRFLRKHGLKIIVFEATVLFKTLTEYLYKARIISILHQYFRKDKNKAIVLLGLIPTGFCLVSHFSFIETL